MKYTFIILLFVSTLFSQEWFSKQSIDCTVLLEKQVDGKYVPHGTGFFIVNYSKKESSYIVTCEHILQGSKISVAVAPDSSFVRFIKKNKIKRFPIGNYMWSIVDSLLRTDIILIQDSTFFKHPEMDIAIIPIELPSSIITLNKDSIKLCNMKSFPKSYMR